MSSFKCSKCKKVITLHPDLATPSKTTEDLLRNASSTPRPKSNVRAYPASRESFLHDALADSTATVVDTPLNDPRTTRNRPAKNSHSNVDAFVVLDLDESQEIKKLHGDRPAPSQALARQRALFEILSKNSDVDHPLCSGCTEVVLQAMHKKTGELERDRKMYITYLRKAKDDLPSQEDYDLAEAELEEVKHQQVLALDDLRAAEQERADVLAELAQLEKESAALDEEERQFWLERNQFAAEITAYEEERDSINLRYDHDVKQLERLQKTNVYNDTFHIGHDGNFGTINGLRLGRLPNHPVSWDEINAALGLTLLLLQTMAEKLRHTFKGYKLYPMGSTSRIEKIEVGSNDVPKVTTLELYSTSEVNPLKMFQRNSFDKAVVAFLDCLKQLGDVAETRDPTVVMPYKIVKDRIGEVCVRTAFNQDGEWTRALKFCLTNCKWILAVVQGSSRIQAMSANPT